MVEPAALGGTAEQIDDLFVRRLPELGVVRADRLERQGRGPTDDLVAFAAQRLHGVARSNRACHDKISGLVSPRPTRAALTVPPAAIRRRQ